VKRLLAVALLALGSACSSGTTFISADFRGPAAVVAFQGVADAGGTPQPWIAVASSRGNELRIIDPETDLPVRNATLAFPLSVPTLARPIYLASGSLHDSLPDALVVASGGLSIQLIGTWYSPVNQIPLFGVAEQWNLDSVVEAGAQIVGLAVASVPTGTPAGDPPVYPVVQGKAWVVAAVSEGFSGGGGSLVVLEIARGEGGVIALGAPVAVKPLGFDPVAIATSPDNFHLYLASSGPIPGANGPVLGIAEVDASAGRDAVWPVLGLDGKAPTTSVAAAILGERTVTAWFNFDAPVLRVFAALDPSGCGPTQPIECGIATFDPLRGGLAADPAPSIGTVPKQGYRTPMPVSAVPLTFAVAMPASIAGPVNPGLPKGAQACYSPATTGAPLPVCPDAGIPGGGFVVFNGGGVPQAFAQIAAGSLWWSSAIGQVGSGDGNAITMDLGRFGPVDFVSPVNDTLTNTQVTRALPVGPAGPTNGTGNFGFPANTSAVGLLNRSGIVDNTPEAMILDIIVTPGFTRNEAWLASYQGLLPSLSLRRGVVGLNADGATLYVAIQEAYAPPPAGVLPAASPWVPLAEVASPNFAIHPAIPFGRPADIAQFILDEDPCLPTRPNWIPSTGGAPVYDPTKPPQAHEAPIETFLPKDAALYPVGALSLGVPTDPTLASEYACLVDALRAQPGTVLTAFETVPIAGTDYLRGIWIRAGEFVLVGSNTGYAGRPVEGIRYDFAWADEEQLAGEALIVSRKARRYWYPAFYEICEIVGCYQGFPEMIDPMAPGPVVGFTLASYCRSPVTPTDCDPATSPPARDAGVSFATVSGFVPTVRRPASASVPTNATTFDKSTIPGLEWKGRVFYTTFAGGVLFDVPPGLDSGQPTTVR
jgi:hypothetical protein